MPNGFALTEGTTAEVICAYAAPMTTLAAVNLSPGWQVVGAFYLPLSCLASLDILGALSDLTLTMRAKLFDATVNADVSGSLVAMHGAGTTTVNRQVSGAVDLTGGHIYQIVAECTGGSGDDFFGTMFTASLS
jgi:hypothetical protein